MLYEIVCDKFKTKKVLFNSGLNTVLGTNEGDNSIGKSSFLLIVDFVFGGTTYAKSEDIIKNIGEHSIKFAFKFSNKMHYFCRSVNHLNEVYLCDENYNNIEKISLKEYCQWIGEQYDFLSPYTTFRKEISRYIRVYGKNNANEKLPLHAFPQEKMNDAVCELLKIFNYYEPIHNILEISNKSIESLKTYKSAQKYKFVSKISKKEYENNIKEIKKIDTELNNLTNKLDQGLIDVEAVISEEAIEIKNNLSRARRMRSKAKMKKDRYDENKTYKFSPVTFDFEELMNFFPNANLKKLEEIEMFHKSISKIFQKEIKSELKKIEQEIMDYDSSISEYENRLRELIKNPNLSKKILKRHNELKSRKDELEMKNDAYNKLIELKNNESIDKKRVSNMKNQQLSILSSKINIEMNRLNNIIYKEENNAPILSFSKNNYSFVTPENTGTGIAYKGLVIFDISVLNLTNLPIIVHDSFILKQISDKAFEKILELYIKSEKQVIIAIDKKNSYTDETQKILDESVILNLGSNGNELFGKSWG